MAAYAALVCLINNIEQIKIHPRVSTLFEEKQLESLLERVDSLLVFIESYNSYGGSKDEAEDLERQITSAAHAAEDVIENHIVDQILPEVARSVELVMQDLWKIIQEMDSVREKVMKVKEDRGCRVELPSSRQVITAMKVKGDSRCKSQVERIQSEAPFHSISASSSTRARESNMVGFDGYLTQVLEEQTGDQPDRKIIPIVVSEGYNVRVILFEILSCLVKSKDGMDEKTEHELGEQLHKTLSGMRYLIVLDDMWGIEVWNEINFFFPNNGSRSRVLVTTRISDVANHFGSMGLALDFLDDDQSWKLFCEKVFSEEACPPELKESGIKIVKKCKGLPLSIVVIGGLLRNSNSSRTLDQWENVERDMRSILNTAEDNRCLKLLALSYSHLPACLKPCFLYLALFAEDEVIHVSRLVKLWVAEGFIKPNKDQSLEEIAEGYVKDLVGRNLIYVHSLRCNGKVKACCIHDLLRDLCLTVARKEEFVCAASVLDAPQEILSWRRHIITPARTTGEMHVSQRSLARSLICKGHMTWGNHRLLRVLIAEEKCNFSSYFNFRFFAHESMAAHLVSISTYHLPSSISLLWNLQTLIMTGDRDGVVAPSEIWKMPQLRHLKFRTVILPGPAPSDGSVLYNLQKLGRVVDFKCSKEACDRMPNIKKLRIYYGDFSRGAETLSYYCIHNVVLLHNLESLHIGFGQQPRRENLLQSLMFPNSLKKLTLEFCQLKWSDMTIYGSLPHLEALKLKFSVSGRNWDPVEGEFLRLKYLRIHFCNLICWNADNTHFPLLEDLVLERCHSLNEIPSGIGDIPTLERICLVDCSISATLSAIRILEEQESMGNEGLQVKVHFRYKSELEFMEQVNLEGLTGIKFQLKGV